jgi:phage-related protein (TIGR01555 family)
MVLNNFETRTTGTYRELYFRYWEAKKIVEIPINDALRRPYKIIGTTPEKEKKMLRKIEEYGFNKILRDCLIMERLDGGCVLFVGYDDGEDLSLPPKKNAKIKYLKMIGIPQIEVREKNFNIFATADPEYEYRINMQSVHEDRMIFFHGQGVAAQKFIFSESVMATVYDDIVHAVEIRERVVRISRKASCVTELASNFITSNSEKLKQLETVLQGTDTDRSIILDRDNVELKEFTTSFADLSELITAYLKVLASALDIPVTRFLGISNSGLNQSADGDLENFYNIVRQLQENSIRRPLRRLLRLLYAHLWGESENTEHLDVEFPSLWNNSEEEEEKIKGMKLALIVEAQQNGVMSLNEAIKEATLLHIFHTKLSKKEEPEDIGNAGDAGDADGGDGDEKDRNDRTKEEED